MIGLMPAAAAASITGVVGNDGSMVMPSRFRISAMASIVRMVCLQVSTFSLQDERDSSARQDGWVILRSALAGARFRTDGEMCMAARYIMSALVVASSMLAGAASGQEYPSKLVRILTSAHGSTNDIVARMIAQGLSANLRQPVIVDNRGTLAAEVLARAEPDGHVLMFYGGSVYLLPLMRPAPYDPIKDLSP